MQALKKNWKTGGSGSNLPQYLPNSKNKFPVKIIFTQSIFVLLSTDKKAKTISLKVFEITEFKNTQIVQIHYMETVSWPGLIFP